MVYETSNRCSICQSDHREIIDRMLLGDERMNEGQRYTYLDIVGFAQDEGLHISTGALSRHRNRHIGPALEMALESQALVDAISKATGKPLSLHTAMVNIIATKIMRQLEHADLADADPVALMRVGARAAVAAGQLSKIETTLTPKMIEQVDEKLTKAGLEPDILERIKKELYGL
jgi:glutathione S-transferase